MTSDRSVLDVLIVGGGPGGTAAAFRARELGLNALVIDYDDLMKRIRDYSKDKMILPSFGGGDEMKFPKGGDLISSLRFEPIDKDDMCHRWKELYQSHEIPCEIGIELTGIETNPDGVNRVLCWNHQKRCEQSFLARHVVVAIGHGVPRRFDIPGNTDGITFRLSDPALYVGEPACVIGGGTSAAEAVIAISRAKSRANDPTAVYWSYRGDKLPRVSKALAEVFFEAYVGNGNIRYHPKSEPAAVVTADDHQEYLALRVDRVCVPDRPALTSHLEFPKKACIACIGEDIPESLLQAIGISMVRGGPRNKKRMVVNRYLETERPNVYLAGDILSQAYFRTDSFDADPSQFEEVKHRGNIKSALRDGVLVADVIKQRLQGKSVIEVRIGDAEDLTPSAKAESGPSPIRKLPPVPEKGDGDAVLYRVRPSGVIEGEYPVPKDRPISIGRHQADISFPDDPNMIDHHASISYEKGVWKIRDNTNRGDLFKRLAPAVKTILNPGDLIRIGRQFLLLGKDMDRFHLDHYDHQGSRIGQHVLSQKTIIIGRDAPDITLSAGDKSLSRRHLAVFVQGGRVQAKDLNSANSSYVRVRQAAGLKHGDQFQIGNELLTFSLGGDEVLDASHFDSVIPIPKPKMPSESTPAARPSAGPVGDGPSVTFKGLNKTVRASEGQTICEIAEANGIPINAECHAGVCGSDPIRIISGKEHLKNQPGDQESETLEDLCDLEPGPCRLACMARITGPVTIEILKK